MKNLFFILLVALLCVGLLAACGDDATTTAGETNISSTEGTQTAEATEPTAGEETTEPTTGEETTEPTPGEETTEPTPGEETTEPTPGEETTEPTPGEETTEPTTGEETTEPTPGEETTEPTPGEEAHTHSYSDWITVVEAGCTTEGWQMRVCSVCGDTKSTSIPASGHFSYTISGWEAGCLTDGMTDGEACAACGMVFVEQKLIPAVGYHTWTEWEIQTRPTIDTDGTRTRTCTACGETQSSLFGNTYEQGDTICDFAIIKDGQEVTLSELLETKKVVVIYFWASWLGSGYNELPTIQTAYETYGDDAEVIALSVYSRDTQSYCNEYAKEKGYSFVLMPDVGLYEKFSHVHGGGSLPGTVVIDRNGVIASYWAGCNVNCWEKVFEYFVSDSYVYSNQTLPIGHAEVVDAAVPATCTESGLTEGKHCSVCGIILTEQEEVATQDHIYVDDVCAVCGRKTVEDLFFVLNWNGMSYIVVGIGTYDAKNLEIPELYDYLPVSGIDDKAFIECTNLTSITIPGSVTSIGCWAFYNCTSLTDIYYKGTMEQWETIDFDDDWIYEAGDYTIHCSDGDIVK